MDKTLGRSKLLRLEEKLKENGRKLRKERELSEDMNKRKNEGKKELKNIQAVVRIL